MVYKSRRKNRCQICFLFDCWCREKLQQKYTITLKLGEKQVLAKQSFFVPKSAKKEGMNEEGMKKDELKLLSKSTEIMQQNMSAQNTEIQHNSGAYITCHDDI